MRPLAAALLFAGTRRVTRGVDFDASIRVAQRTVGNRALATALTGVRAGRRAPDDQSQLLNLQRWDSLEHVELGESGPTAASRLIVLACHSQDLPQRRQPLGAWPPAWRELYQHGSPEQRRALTGGLTYGEVVALSGDFYDGWAALNRAPLREIYDLIPLIRHRASTSRLQAATGGRYLVLAKRNESHFSNVRPGHRNIDVWWRGHAAAIEAARAGDADTAWGMNASADHFLTDAFAGGHIRVERKRLMDQGALGNIQSKILHDLDNEHGVEVTNSRGDGPWIAYGDDMLGDVRNTRNRELAMEAVRLSRQDVADGLARRRAYPQPVPGTVFAAERLIPRPVDASRDRWTGRRPTFVRGSDGTPVRLPDDYTRTRDRVVIREGPGVVAGLTTDDDRVRAWIARHDEAAIGRQGLDDKVRMIRVLLSGPTLDGDERSILKILRGAARHGDQSALVSAVGAYALMNDFHGREAHELRVFLRAHYYPRVEVDTALSVVLRAARGPTREWEEEMIIDAVELTSRPRALIEAVGRSVGGPAIGPARDFHNGVRELDSQLDGAEQDRLDQLIGR